VHPIAGDNTSATQAFVRSLTRESFADIEAFFAAQAKRYSAPLKQPFIVRAGAVLRRATSSATARREPTRGRVVELEPTLVVQAGRS